jgi:hypothetical protein
MTNIHVLKFFLFSFFVTTIRSHDILEIHLCNLCPENLQFLQEAATRYPGYALHIMVIPNTPFKMELIPEPSWWQQLTNPQKVPNSASFFTLPNVGYYVLKFAFGSSLISYCTVFYCIYRSYSIIKKIYGIVQWCNGAQKENSETLETIKSMLYRKKTFMKPRITKEEFKILRNYAKLNTILKKLRLRSLFPFDQNLENFIEQQLIFYADNA